MGCGVRRGGHRFWRSSVDAGDQQLVDAAAIQVHHLDPPGRQGHVGAHLGQDARKVENQAGHGFVIAILGKNDLTRVQAISAAGLIRQVAKARDTAQMAAITARIPELLTQLVQARQRHEIITRMITDIADAVTRRLLDLTAADLGPAPAAWCWAACGSQGRQEQTGASDQDNCLILAPGARRLALAATRRTGAAGVG